MLKATTLSTSFTLFATIASTKFDMIEIDIHDDKKTIVFKMI